MLAVSVDTLTAKGLCNTLAVLDMLSGVTLDPSLPDVPTSFGGSGGTKNSRVLDKAPLSP